MGYRSQVAVAMHKEDFLRFKAAFEAKADADPDFDGGVSWAFSRRLEKVPGRESYCQFLASIDGVGMKEVRGKYVILTWNWWKWYTEFADVKFVMDFLEGLEDYQYVRIGEETTDVDYESPGDMDLIYPGIGMNLD